MEDWFSQFQKLMSGGGSTPIGVQGIQSAMPSSDTLFGSVGIDGVGATQQSIMDSAPQFGLGANGGPGEIAPEFGGLTTPEGGEAGIMDGFFNQDGSFNIDAGLKSFQALSAGLQGYGAYQNSKSNAAFVKHGIGKDRLETDNNVALAQTRLNDQGNKMAYQRPDLYGNRATTQLQSFGTNLASNTNSSMGNYGNPNNGGGNNNDRNRRLGG